jgi:hypothetical protein
VSVHVTLNDNLWSVAAAGASASAGSDSGASQNASVYKAVYESAYPQPSADDYGQDPTDPIPVYDSAWFGAGQGVSASGSAGACACVIEGSFNDAWANAHAEGTAALGY